MYIVKGLKMSEEIRNKSVLTEKEASAWIQKALKKMFKGYEYSMSLFGLYNIQREGSMEELISLGFIDPDYLRKRHMDWEWSLKSLSRGEIVFKGSATTGAELVMKIHSLSKGSVYSSIEDLKALFNLLRVRFPQKLNTMRKKTARANVNPIRQRTQFTCVSTSTCMALNALGVQCSEDDVNRVIGAKPMKGARWEEVLACAQYFGARATLTTPATLTQVKEWTDAGKPVLIAWNPEGREWSHASLIFDVTGEKGSYLVHIADPNIPNPDKTVRLVEEDDFYGKWFEKWPDYLVRRPALMIDREITSDGRQVMASEKPNFFSVVKEMTSTVRHLGYLMTFDRGSSKICTKEPYLVFKISVPGIGHYSLDFERNNVSLYEGGELLKSFTDVKDFPDILRFLPKQLADMSLKPQVKEMTVVDGHTVEEITDLLNSDLPKREKAHELQDLIPSTKDRLSKTDRALREMNKIL